MHARTTLYAFRYTLPRVLRLVLAYPGRVQIEFKVAEIAIEIFTRTVPDDYTTICSLNLPPFPFPSSTRSSGFFLRGRESILNCTRTVFPFTRRFSETLKLAELLKRTRKRGEITIVKEQWFDRGRETRVRNDRSVRSRAETRFPLKANLPTTENFPR